MASHNKPTAFALLIDTLAKLPWQVLLVSTLACFGYLHIVGFDVQMATPVFAPVILVLTTAAKYVVPTLLLVATGMSYLGRAHRQQLLKQAALNRSLEFMSWQEFELLVGEAFRQRGFKVREMGGAGPDGGVDLVLTKNGETFLVQCKQWKALKVGVEIVREIFGVTAAEGASGCYVVTSGRFTAPAKDFAKGRNIQLIDGPALLDLLDQAHRQQTPTNGVQTPSPSLANASAHQAVHKPAQGPECPHCAVPMVKRYSKQSRSAFWGCSQFPRCKGVRPY